MVDELTNESFQTGKAIVTVSVDIIQAIADACRKSEENKALTAEQKENVLTKVVGMITDNYKETHGSLKSFNKDGKDVAHLDVTDERTAEIIKDVCKKSHIPVDMQEKPRADGTCSYVAFCEVKNVDQLTGILKMASEQVAEEQKAMTKEELQAIGEKREPIILPRFSCHVIRHTFCTRLCENETNLKVIQDVMGHKDIQTTMDIYAEVSEQKKKDSFEKLNGKDVL